MIKLTLALVVTFSMFASLSFAKDNSKNMDMSKMQMKMEDMQKTMNKISITKDPKKKNELMRTHMKDMQEQMKKMSSMMGEKGMMGGENMGMMGNPENMVKMHRMMANMMGQMQGHDETCMYMMNQKVE